MLELINNFCQLLEYKISVQKACIYIYTNKLLMEWKVKDIIPFLIISITIKRLEINVTKGEKYSLKIKIHWWNILKKACSWVGSINIVKMSILLKVIYRFSELSIKIPMNFLKIEKKIFKFLWNHKRLWKEQSNIGKEEQS